MNLSDFCRRITGPDTRLLPENHKLGARLVCPEYSKSVQEVKTYPLLGQDRSFLLCWNFDSPGNLYATMMPSPENFCYHYSYSEGKYTQLHTHDYLELSYVVEGEFHQRILNKDVVFQKGDLCLIDKNCLHQDCLTDQSGVVLFIGIANDMFTEIMNENSTPQKILSFLQSALLKQKGCPAISAFPTIRRGKRISGRQSFVAFERILFAGQWFQIYYKRSVIPDLPDLKYTV